MMGGGGIWDMEMKGFGALPPVKVAGLVLSAGTKPAGSLWGVSSKTVNLSMALEKRPFE
jgi:hypothetical protein